MRLNRATCLLVVIVGALVLCPSLARADAELPEWFGKWDMNHDGNVGTLLIKNDVTTGNQPWKHWTLLYTYKEGNQVKQVTGKVTDLDQKNQHMKFELAFSDNVKRSFDAYLFSWDKSKMAGTERYMNRTFGFYANKVGSGDIKD